MSKNYLRAAARAMRGTTYLTTVLNEMGVRPPEGPHARAAKLSEAFAELCEIHGFDVTLTGDVPAGPAVIVANHLSYLDPVVMLARMPAVPIAKAEVGDWPIIGTGAKALGVLLVNRACPTSRVRALRGALRALENGVPVINFPEGTTTDGSHLLPFHRGIFGAARLARVPVVPVALGFDTRAMTWTGDQTLLPHYLATAARPGTRIFIEVGKPIPFDSANSAEDLSDRARGAISHMLRRMTHDAAERLRILETRTDAVFSAAAR